MHQLNYVKTSIAIAATGILLSSPAYAHGGGMTLLFIGLPFLAVMFLFYLIGALSTAPTGKRFSTFIQSLFVGALWLAIFMGPWFQYQIELFLRNYEGTWAIAVPITLFFGSQTLRKHFRKTTN
jgi:hypothetical protein